MENASAEGGIEITWWNLTQSPIPQQQRGPIQLNIRSRGVKQNQSTGRGITLIAPPSAPPPPDEEEEEEGEEEKRPVPQQQPMPIQLTAEETRREELVINKISIPTSFTFWRVYVFV
jgi:hypothetical protein